jgi:glycosyltransferase involved in cell wall biosynthesis
MEKIRILVIANMYPPFMGGDFIHVQVKELINIGCNINVIVPVAYFPRRLRFNSKWSFYADCPEKDIVDSVPVYYPRYIRLPGKWFHSFSCFSQYLGLRKTVRAIMKEFNPHIIHAHSATVPGYVGLMLGRKYNLPLICTLHGSDIYVYPNYDLLSMYITQKIISEADQLLTVSDALKIEANNIAKPRKEIHVIYNGCNSNTFVYNEEARRHVRTVLGISEHANVLIFIGRIEKDKGVFELLDSFKRLHSQHSDLHLIFVGHCAGSNPLDMISPSSKLSERIHVIGNQPHGEIYKYLSSADILILPSYSEGLPMVVLEAMACSLPVIATRVGGIPEAVAEGKSGILIEKKNVESLTEAIKYLLTHKDIARRMGNNGHEIVKNKFSWGKSAEGVLNVYKEIINVKS